MELNTTVVTTTDNADNATEDDFQQFVEDLLDVFGDSADLLTALENCEIIWKVGLVFSALGLLLITSTWILFSKWRHYKNYISWNQCFSTIVMSWFQAAVFLGVLPEMFNGLEDESNDDDDDNSPSSRKMDILLGIADYFELASMCWTVSAAVLCYAQVVLVFDRNCSHKYTKVTLLCWGVPLILKGIIVLIDTFVDTEDDPAINYEIIPLVPIIIMALINVYCYVRVIICVIRRKHDERRKVIEAVRTITTGLFLLFIFMFTFVMHFLSLLVKGTNDFKLVIVILYILTVLCAFHGGVLAFCFILAIRSARNMWVQRFYKKKRGTTSTTESTTFNATTSAATAVNV